MSILLLTAIVKSKTTYIPEHHTFVEAPDLMMVNRMLDSQFLGPDFKTHGSIKCVSETSGHLVLTVNFFLVVTLQL